MQKNTKTKHFPRKTQRCRVLGEVEPGKALYKYSNVVPACFRGMLFADVPTPMSAIKRGLGSPSGPDTKSLFGVRNPRVSKRPRHEITVSVHGFEDVLKNAVKMRTC